MGLELVHEYWARPRTSTSMIQFDRLHARHDVGVGVSTRAETPLSTLEMQTQRRCMHRARRTACPSMKFASSHSPHSPRVFEEQKANSSSSRTNAFVMTNQYSASHDPLPSPVHGKQLTWHGRVVSVRETGTFPAQPTVIDEDVADLDPSR